MTRISLLLLIAFLGIAFFPAEEEFEESKKRGKELYEEMCITCHMGNGEGLQGAFPPIAKSDFLTKYPEDAIRAVKFGQSGEIEVNGVKYNSYMPDPGLEDQEIADIMNYIRNAWGNQNDTMLTAKMVAELEKK